MSSSWENYRKESPIQGTNGFWGGTGGGLVTGAGEINKENADWSALTTGQSYICLLYTSPSPRDRTRSRMPSSA